MAVPFWLAVAPMVSTKRDTRGGSLSLFSATRSAVGSVAFDEAVEKAITIASWLWRKNHDRRHAADELEQQRIDDEHLDAEREQHDADIGAEADQQVPAEQRGEVEHEAGDRDRRERMTSAISRIVTSNMPSIAACSASARLACR